MEHVGVLEFCSSFFLGGASHFPVYAYYDYDYDYDIL